MFYIFKNNKPTINCASITTILKGLHIHSVAFCPQNNPALLFPPGEKDLEAQRGRKRGPVAGDCRQGPTATVLAEVCLVSNGLVFVPRKKLSKEEQGWSDVVPGFLGAVRFLPLHADNTDVARNRLQFGRAPCL